MELTFVQLIDTLEHNQTAEVTNKKGYLKVRNFNGDLHWINDEGDVSQLHSKPLRVTRYTKELKWTILPQYLTFEEAMKALKEGKRVKSHELEPNTFHKSHRIISFDTQRIEGKWTIEN